MPPLPPAAMPDSACFVPGARHSQRLTGSPESLLRKIGPDRLAYAELQILIIYRPHGSRRLLNMEQVLALCNAWAPGVGGFTSARCRPIEFQDGFLGDLAALQRAHIMVRSFVLNQQI